MSLFTTSTSHPPFRLIYFAYNIVNEVELLLLMGSPLLGIF